MRLIITYFAAIAALYIAIAASIGSAAAEDQRAAPEAAIETNSASDVDLATERTDDRDLSTLSVELMPV